MEYVDEKGKVYEISYSQKLQREQNKLHRQQNMLLFFIIVILILFGIGVLYLYFRLATIDFLTTISKVLVKLA